MVCASPATSVRGGAQKRSRAADEGGDHSAVVGAHPYGVRPLGNQYFDAASSGGGGVWRDFTTLGLGSLRAVTDEMLLLVLDFVDVSSLCKLMVASRACYAFSVCGE